MKEAKLRLILLAGFFVLLLCIAGAMLFALRAMPKLSYLEPHRIITPTPGFEQQDSVEANTPQATPVHLIRTPAPVLPEYAVNLLSDGDALFALDSRETAELLLRTYFQQCAYENIDENSILLKATMVSSVSTVPADGSVEYMTFDAALNKLRKNRSLISVQRTVERATVKTESSEQTSERTALLPEGSYLYRRYGTPARTLILSEIIYKDGFAASDTETLNRQISFGSAQSLLIGTYRSAQPDKEPGPKEGSVGKPKEKLSFVAPVRGTVISFFGMRYNTMHYGIDFSANANARIVAPEDGTVIFCGERPGYGMIIEIRHENGFVSRIASCANVTVELEQHVKRGSVIAQMPQTENREKPVLHYELLIDGIPYNPLYYLT